MIFWHIIVILLVIEKQYICSSCFLVFESIKIKYFLRKNAIRYSGQLILYMCCDRIINMIINIYFLFVLLLASTVGTFWSYKKLLLSYTLQWTRMHACVRKKNRSNLHALVSVSAVYSIVKVLLACTSLHHSAIKTVFYNGLFLKINNSYRKHNGNQLQRASLVSLEIKQINQHS